MSEAMADPEIPDAAVRAGAEVLCRSWQDGNVGYDTPCQDHVAEAREVLAAALPHLGAAKRPRITCWACGRDVVRRGDGTPAFHIRGDGDGGQCAGAHRHGPKRPTRYRQPSRAYRTPPATTTEDR